MARSRKHGRTTAPVHYIDRLVYDIEHGKFERSLSGLTAASALVTGAEIFFEHDRASFGNKVMWCMAKTALPFVSALVVLNGLQGTYLHVRGIAQRPGGWKMALYNIEMGPPLFAPLLFTTVGGMGLLAAILRREAE
jgi:hypothetical protein